MPVQPSGAHGIEGSIEIERESKDGLLDLLEFERIILIYLFNHPGDFPYRLFTS